MPDLISIIQKRWKLITAVTLAALLVATMALLLVPKQYLSTTTALPANSLATDKGAVFNSSIQELYSSLGTPDELDRFLGTAKLDTVYIAVAQAHNLQKHYAVAQNDHALFNAARKLKKETRIERTEYGELQVKVWDKDRTMAAQLANSIMERLQLLHQQLQSRSNALVLQKLEDAYLSLQRTTTLGTSNNLDQQATQYESLIAQYTLMVNTNPPALLVVEEARPALTHDKPYLLPTLPLTFFAAFVFALLLAFFMESRKNV